MRKLSPDSVFTYNLAIETLIFVCIFGKKGLNVPTPSSAAQGCQYCSILGKSIKFGSDVVLNLLNNPGYRAKNIFPIWPPFSKWPPHVLKTINTSIKICLRYLFLLSFVKVSPKKVTSEHTMILKSNIVNQHGRQIQNGRHMRKNVNIILKIAVVKQFLI